MLSDKEMIARPSSWPNWPVLPVKRNKKITIHGSDCGILVEAKGFENTVIECNMWGLGLSGGSLADVLKDDKIPKHKYESVDKLLEDGWKVD